MVPNAINNPAFNNNVQQANQLAGQLTSRNNKVNQSRNLIGENDVI